ncbi:16S rRNA (cytosine(1402)-N(4))-methyltransferase [Snodgrassella sp. CFCC 13594]|uniref:16S rRNA (cytosine(1402)-N(4))-methyltransferase n=1 Tax=Snodgrassella sp. CFCC 13594 TaxID=1775559 RepID=UPI0009ED3BCB
MFVDVTSDRCGHSREPLSRLDTDPRLVVLDKDIQALVAAVGRFPFLDCVASFADLATQLKQLGIASVDGIMADLAVSSPQLD